MQVKAFKHYTLIVPMDREESEWLRDSTGEEGSYAATHDEAKRIIAEWQGHCQDLEDSTEWMTLQECMDRDYAIRDAAMELHRTGAGEDIL